MRLKTVLGLVAAIGASGLLASAVQRDATPTKAPTDLSAQRVKYPSQPSGPRIACTATGCRPVPAGCTPVAGQDWDGNYSGFDEVVCR